MMLTRSTAIPTLNLMMTKNQSDDDAPRHAAEDVFLTGKAIRSEANLKSLNAEDRKKFDASMEKEWASWQRFNAVEVLFAEQVEQLPDDTQVVGTRWVHTDKNGKARLLAGALNKKTNKPPAQLKAGYPLEAKSRLVVQGCQ